MEKEKTPKELEKIREDSLAYLSDSVMKSLALMYKVENDENEGEADKQAVHDLKYLSAMQSEKAGKLMFADLIQSRKDGKRLTGTADEYRMAKSAGGMFDGSIIDVYVQDLIDLTGSKIEIDDKYKGKYVFELLEGNDDEQKAGKALVGQFNEYFINSGISEAREGAALFNQKALESIVQKAA